MFVVSQGLQLQHSGMRVFLLFALSLLPSASFAGTIALTPVQMEAAKEAGARAHAHDGAVAVDGIPLLGGAPRDRQIHGEVGVSVGTDGYSAFYGAAIVPLGESGTLALALAQENERQIYRGRGLRNVR